MPIVDLTTAATRPAPPSAGPIDAAPRRLGLTLPELQYAARLAGDAPLPFDLAEPTAYDGIQARLGRSPATLDDEAYRGVLAALHDPEEALNRRGLVAGGRLDEGVAGAIGLLAAPRLAVDVDVSTGGVRARAWHRQAGAAVATLATADGVAFELGWLPAQAWAGELARVAAVSDEVALGDSAVPAYADLPFELGEAAAEAGSIGRGDLLPVLAARHSGAVRGPDGSLADDAVVRLLTALTAEAQGRLRALAADVADTTVTPVGVVSWTLLADGWRALRTHVEDGVPRIELRAVEAHDLAAALAPALAQVLADEGDPR